MGCYGSLDPTIPRPPLMAKEDPPFRGVLFCVRLSPSGGPIDTQTGVVQVGGASSPSVLDLARATIALSLIRVDLPRLSETGRWADNARL